MTDLPVDEPTEADPEDLRDRNEALSLALEALSREHEASSSIARAMATAIGWETPGEWVDKAAHLAPPAAELAATRDDRRDGAGLVGGRSAAPTRPWSFSVNFEGGPQRTDYGTGVEWDGWWIWSITDGDPDPDAEDAVLAGTAAEDPTPVLTEVVAAHNDRALLSRSAAEPPRQRVNVAALIESITEGLAAYEGTDDEQLHQSMARHLVGWFIAEGWRVWRLSPEDRGVAAEPNKEATDDGR